MSNQEIQRAINYLKYVGVTTLAFDMDDTLFTTSRHIRHYIDVWEDQITHQTQIPKEELHAAFEQINGRAFDDPEIQVRKMRWQWICTELAKIYPAYAESFTATGLVAYYQSSPELFPGARETVQTVVDNGLKTIAITHADPAWHQAKMSEHNMRHLFSYQLIVDPEHFKAKTAENWSDAMKGLGSKPEQTIAIGDGIKPDILAALAAGVHSAVHIKPEWAKYAEGNVPDHVSQIEGISKLLAHFASLSPTKIDHQ